MPPVDVVVRRARFAGIGGWVAFGIAVLGFALFPNGRPFWIALGFLGLGSVLGGVLFVVAAARMKRMGKR